MKLALAAAAGTGIQVGSVLATASGAVCSALYRPYLRQFGVERVSVAAMLASLPFLAIVRIYETLHLPPVYWSIQTWALIGFADLLSGVGYLVRLSIQLQFNTL